MVASRPPIRRCLAKAGVFSHGLAPVALRPLESGVVNTSLGGRGFKSIYAASACQLNFRPVTLCQFHLFKRSEDGAPMVISQKKHVHSHATSSSLDGNADIVEALRRFAHPNTVPSVRLTDSENVAQDSVSSHKRVGSKGVRLGKENREIRALLARCISSLSPHQLAEAVENGGVGTSTEISNLFGEDEMKLLSSRGYQPADILLWAWILTAKLSEDAAKRLQARGPAATVHQNRPVPHFVLLLLLRRPKISASALRILLAHTRSTLEKPTEYNESGGHAEEKSTDAPRQSHTASPKMSQSTIIVLLTRLLRHSRKTLPEAAPEIAALFAEHVNFTHQNEHGLSQRQTRWLTLSYNRFLSLLAEPSSISPFSSNESRMKAQVIILRKMTEIKPPLLVNREGYQAVIRTQLARPKTSHERKWASMKSSSWPPWKEEKLAIDADVEPELGKSRAKQAIQKARESGYASHDWEDAASILSGWDVDNSPTIQTRALLTRSTKFSGDTKHTAGKESVWASRIRATRNLDEAWAIFLQYKQETLPPSTVVYLEVAKKIHFDQLRKENAHVSSEQTANTEPTQAGDSPEVFGPPRDPRNRVYASVPPPSLDQFFDTAAKDGVPFERGLLYFSAAHSSSVDSCKERLRRGKLSTDAINFLTGEGYSPEFSLDSIPPNLLAAIVQNYTRKDDSVAAKTLEEECAWEPMSIPGTAGLGPASYAFQIVRLCSPSHPTPWKHLLRKLAQEQTVCVDEGLSQSKDVQKLATWNMMVHVYKKMSELDIDIDADSFRLLCLGLAKAIRASSEAGPQSRRDTTSPSNASNSLGTGVIKTNRKRFMGGFDKEHGLQLLKGVFQRLTGISPTGCGGPNGPATAIAPREDTLAPQIPNAAVLHSFIKTLGHAEAYATIKGVMNWMASHSHSILHEEPVPRNTRIQLRRCLVAVRAILERAGQFESSPEKAGSSGGEIEVARLQEIKEVVESVGDWGGWPSDEELEQYLLRSRHRVHNRS